MTAEGTAERAPGTRRWTDSGWTLGHYRCPVASDSPGADVTSARGSGRAQQRAWTQTPSQGDGRCDLHVISGQHGTRRVTAAATAISPVLPAERPPWVGLGTLPPVTPAAPVSTAHTSHGHSSQGRRERAGPPRLHWLRGAPPPAPRPLPLVFRGSVLSAQTHPHEHDKRDAGGTRADPSERGRTRDHGQDTEAAGAPHTALGAELPTRRLNKLPRGGHR